MAIKYAGVGTASALTLSSVNSLGAAGYSGLMTYDNSTALDLYANVLIVLGSITPTVGIIELIVYSCQDGTVPDNTGSVGGGDRYPGYVTYSASAKNIVIPFVRLYWESLRFQIRNGLDVPFAASGNSISVKPAGEG